VSRRSVRAQQVLFGVAVAVALLLLSAIFPHSFPRGILLKGAIFGLAAGLLAVGIILVYRTTKVINFAYGAMGSTAAESGIVAYQRAHLGWGLCVAIALVVGAIIGLAAMCALRSCVTSLAENSKWMRSSASASTVTCPAAV